MTFYIEQCVQHTINGAIWQRIPGTERDAFDEAEDVLVSLRGEYDLLRIGREK